MQWKIKAKQTIVFIWWLISLGIVIPFSLDNIFEKTLIKLQNTWPNSRSKTNELKRNEAWLDSTFKQW